MVEYDTMVSVCQERERTDATDAYNDSGHDYRHACRVEHNEIFHLDMLVF